MLAYVESTRGTDKEVSLFELFLLTLITVLRERPAPNRYFIARRLYQRHDVTISFAARREYTDDAERRWCWA